MSPTEACNTLSFSPLPQSMTGLSPCDDNHKVRKGSQQRPRGSNFIDTLNTPWTRSKGPQHGSNAKRKAEVIDKIFKTTWAKSVSCGNGIAQACATICPKWTFNLEKFFGHHQQAPGPGGSQKISATSTEPCVELQRVGINKYRTCFHLKYLKSTNAIRHMTYITFDEQIA